MNLVVLDGHTLNPGDLSWEPLRSLAACTIHDRTPTEEILPRAAGAELVLTNKTPLRRETLEALPGLRFIGVLATGYNVVDVAAARERGIPVCNVPGYGTPSVAQHVFALLLELTQHVGRHAASVRAGEWAACPDFCYALTPLTELAGKTLGVVGWGEIGRAVGQIGRAFGMRIIASSRTPKDDVECVSVDELFRTADVVTLHCPLTAATQGLVNAARLASMKRGSFLLNTARGPLVVEDDLAAALASGHLAGAGLDVLSTEPPPAGHPLFSAPNCLITPHLAWATRSARERLLATVVENVQAFLAGRPQNVVN